MKNNRNLVGRSHFALLAFMALLCANGFILLSLGRVLWCSCGTFSLWMSDAWSSHTSQHLFDPYSFSHFQHGVIFYLVLFLIKVNPKIGFWISSLTELAWEMLENSDFIISRYRQSTASLDYFGDSVFNSSGDIISCAVGFLLTSKISWKLSIAIYVFIEAVMLFTIRDSLTINIIMLVSPIESLKAWQMLHK